MRKELELLDIQQLFDYMVLHEKIDDWRDLFQYIHNWGYNTDFTYNDITNPEEHSLKEYLIEFIMQDKDEDEE